MTDSLCRSCHGALFEKPVLALPGMPRSAQGFLDSPEGAGDLVDLDLRQCRGCGLVQLTNSPVAYYREVITSAAWSDEMVAFRRAQARRFVEGFGLRDRDVIEIGCGEGYYLDLLGEAGARARGLEAGAAAVARARAAGRDVTRGYVTELDAPLRPHAGFVCINFLEHAPAPLEFLRGIAALLDDGGVGLVEVPSLPTVIAKKRFYDFILDHLSYFTAETLRGLLEHAGFEVLSCENAWKDNDLVAHVRKRPLADFNDWTKDNPIVASFVQLTEDRRFRRIVVWGASHQAMSLIALARPRRVSFIVDSSPRKQERFEPSLGLPIRAPTVLAADASVDLVVVTAAGYSDEVVGTLRDKLGYRGHIAVLREDHFEMLSTAAEGQIA